MPFSRVALPVRRLELTEVSTVESKSDRLAILVMTGANTSVQDLSSEHGST